MRYHRLFILEVGFSDTFYLPNNFPCLYRSRYSSRRSRSRSRGRSRRSRSRGHSRHYHSMSRSRSKERQTLTQSKEKGSSWDVQYVTTQSKYPEEQIISKDESVFNVIKDANSKKAIEIKVPSAMPVEKKRVNTDSLYGRWEAYEPKPKQELNSYTKLCREIAAKEGFPDQQTVHTDTDVHHPFKVAATTSYIPPYTNSAKHTPMVSLN